MNLKSSLVVFLTWCFCTSSFAQGNADEMVRNRIIEQRIEIITESLEEGVELDYTTLLDDLNYYYDQNINLNNATQDELASLYLLTDFQINALFNHLAQFGQLKQIWELQAVESWDEVTIYNILPFVTVNPPSELTGVSLKKILNEGKHDLFLRYTETLEDQRGYLPAEEGSTASRYLGDQRRYYARYRFTFANNLSLGFTAEKDPGEEFFTGTQKNGFDFYSAHLFYQDKTRIRKLAVGDFQAQFGQGLTLWSGLAFGKTAAAMNVKRIPLGIRPYTSVDENRFLRGGAVTLGWGDVELTAFYSRKAIDANLVVDPDTTSEELNQTITSFQLTGFHRTENEIFDKDAIMETYMGANLSVKKRRWNVGVTAVASEFDADVERNLALYNQFDFNSNENQVVGVDYGYTKNNVSFFGETSVSANGGWATLNGLLVALHPKASVAIMQRHFTRVSLILTPHSMA